MFLIDLLYKEKIDAILVYLIILITAKVNPNLNWGCTLETSDTRSDNYYNILTCH